MTTRKQFLLFLALLLAPLIVLGFAGCGGGSDGGGGGAGGEDLGDEARRPGGTGGWSGGKGGGAGGCRQDGDCATGQCANNCEDAELNFCFDPCTSDDECFDGKTCQAFCGGTLKECRASAVFSCTADDECEDGQICDPTWEICTAGCRTHSDCKEDEICNQDALGCEAACTSDGECDEDAGEQCVDGACVAPDDTCEDNADCYDLGAFYCAAGQGGADNFCADIACGVSYNNCNTCTDGPNAGARDENGPVIFGASDLICAQTSACDGAAPWACRFSFFAFDPDNDLPTSNLAAYIIPVSGPVATSFGLRRDGAGEYSFHAGCFGAPTPFGKRATVFLKDTSGNASNTLCFGD